MLPQQNNLDAIYLMNRLPLLQNYEPQDIIAWKDGLPITQSVFLSHVESFKKILPDHPYVINLCTNRYHFLVGFAAALIRGQTTLLPPNNVSGVLHQIDESYPKSYYLTDNAEILEGHFGIILRIDQLSETLPFKNPSISESHIAAIAFTSGSTGSPRPNLKTWGSLVSIAQKTGVRIKTSNSDARMTIVATVPHQHMYGLETSILLPIQHGWAFASERPFFPEDIRATLSQIPSPRLLVSTPIHLRSCVTEQATFPTIEAILSATAPLSESLAHEAEKMFRSTIVEIYGFAEAGTIATRQTVRETPWKLLDGLSLSTRQGEIELEAPYHPVPIPIPDTVTLQSPQEFLLDGRPGSLINIGGHRASLDDLSIQLTSIDGVNDAVFYLPQTTQDSVSRLIAFAVAPGKTEDHILANLRTKIAPAFLPRPLYLVDSLPRNSTGKLPADALTALVYSHTSINDTTKPSAPSIPTSTEITVTIGSDHPSLSGHFPGKPVVPGVVILSEVLDAIRQDEGTSIALLEAQSVKFHSPLQPNVPLTITLDPRQEQERTFSCKVGSTLVSSGQIRYRLLETHLQKHS